MQRLGRATRLYLGVVLIKWGAELIGDDMPTEGLQALVALARSLQELPA